MDSERWRRIERVLDAVLAAERAHWPVLLDRHCHDDPELRRDVAALLGRVGDVERFPAAPSAGLAAAVLAETHAADAHRYEGRRIGGYRIVREIGRGGMARVFHAERADGQFEQQVALKLLRPGLDTDTDRKRFLVERQILATLDHPHIARLFDGGVTTEGQPYLILEYVDGLPIDAYCDAGALSIRRRLELFLTVCDATQYAHRRLIVHRDLKPSNILVAANSGVKLLDFGLAKLLEPSAPLLTRTRQRWMTPEYAAPEQVLGQPVTTLTDVFQLGVVLYQLLAGRLPFHGRGDSLHELERAVLLDEPAPPSSVRPALRGDLDAIVLKALCKEPEARYASVDALAEDVRRHLAARPVHARPPSVTYRARTFLRRRRMETLAGTIILVTVAGGVASSLLQARRAGAARDRAEAVSHESEAVTSFLLGLFDASNPDHNTKGDSLTARELLQRGVARAEQLRGQPAVQARMLETTGRIFQALGQYDSGQALMQRALLLRRAAYGPDGVEVASSLLSVAGGLLRLNRFAGADSAARQALAIQERVLERDDPTIVTTLHQLANIAVYRGDLSAAEHTLQRVFELRKRAPADSATALAHLHYGAVLQRLGRPADAEREYRRAQLMYEQTVGPYHLGVADAILHVAYVIDNDDARAREAEPLYRRALEIRRRAYGDGHPLVEAARNDLAGHLSLRGEHAQAIAIAREYADILRRVYGREHSAAAFATNRLATVLHRAGMLNEAEPLLRDALAVERRARGENHGNVVGMQCDLARLLIDRGELTEADTLLREALRIAEQAAATSRRSSIQALRGVILTRRGEYTAADSVLQHAIRELENVTTHSHPSLREAYGWLAELYDAWSRPTEAARYHAIAGTMALPADAARRKWKSLAPGH